MSARISARRSAAALVAAAALTIVAPGAGLAATSGASFTDIENDVMCVSCHEPLALAQSPQAIREKAYLRQLIAEGLTKPQIENALVGQYGLAVLGKPPAHGFNLTVYILPPAVLLAGVAILLYTLPKWRARSRAAASTPLPSAQPLAQADAARLDDELGHFV